MADMNGRRAGLANQCSPLERALSAADYQTTLAVERVEIHKVAGMRNALTRNALANLGGRSLEVF